MIYHICPPDIKFVPSLINRFEQIRPDFNRCIIIVSKHHLNPKVALAKNLIEYFGPLNSAVVSRIHNSECHGIVVHTLNDDILELSLELAKRYPVIWRSWGADLHDILYPDFDFLLPHTKDLVYERSRICQASRDYFRPLAHWVTGKEKRKRERILKKIEFLRSIHSIATVTKNEYKMLQVKVPGIKAAFIPLNYRSMDIDRLPGLNNTNEKKIMIGHSSFPYLNHADILYQVKEFSCICKFVLTLSYGSAEYKNKIIALGNKLFKERIEFQTDYLKFPDYLRLLNDCSVFIHNGKVQSGGGNIMYFLYQGSKVYLREENPVFIDFNEMGMKLFSIQHDLSDHHLQEEISMQDKIRNRDLIFDLFSSQREKENVVLAFKNIFNLRPASN